VLTRRSFARVLAIAPAIAGCVLRAETPSATSLRGKLHAGDKPVLVLPDGRRAELSGDAETELVLNDSRLDGIDFEVVGKWESAQRFAINPMHLRAMFVHQGGKRLFVTYWCDVCSIRTYTPGLCLCCRKETDLDLRESLD
jgi:hypothetical protein